MATIKVELEIEESDLKQYLEEENQHYDKSSKWEYISAAMDELPFVVNIVQVETENDDFDDYYTNEDDDEDYYDNHEPLEFDCD